MPLPKVRLAVNYSPQAAALFERGAVDFDLYKCPPWPDVLAAARRQRPAYVHFEANAGQGRPAEEELDRLAALFVATETPYFNTHLAPRRADLDAAAAATDEATRRAVALERVGADVARLVRRFGGARVAVENVPWERFPEFALDPVAVEPALMREVLAASGARLLLDLAHARLTAVELGCDARGLVAPLPLMQLVELHVTGLGRDASGRRRDHMPMTGEDWDLLAWALGEITAGRWARPWAVALEYGGVGPIFEWRSDEAVLAEQLPRLAALLAAAGLR